MPIVSAAARMLHPKYTLDEILLYVENHIEAKVLYFAQLIARGEYTEIENFIHQIKNPGELETIFNQSHAGLNGTILHTVLIWNTGESALKIVSLLMIHGAVICKDSRGNFPGEVPIRTWYDLVSGNFIYGGRDPDAVEFTQTLHEFRCKYLTTVKN